MLSDCHRRKTDPVGGLGKGRGKNKLIFLNCHIFFKLIITPLTRLAFADSPREAETATRLVLSIAGYGLNANNKEVTMTDCRQLKFNVAFDTPGIFRYDVQRWFFFFL
jgi:hypothetical protein